MGTKRQTTGFALAPKVKIHQDNHHTDQDPLLGDKMKKNHNSSSCGKGKMGLTEKISMPDRKERWLYRFEPGFVQDKI